MSTTTLRRLIALVMAFGLLTAACGSSGDVDGDGGGLATEDPTATTAPEPDPTEAPDPEPTDEPDPEPTDEPDPEPTDEPDPVEEAPTSIMLDDPALGMEPVDVAYRAQLDFSMEATLADGTVQMGSVSGDGGKLLPDTHSMVLDIEGLTTIPGDCIDLAALSPGYTSAYFTFSGGLTGDDGGDLMGEAFLFEAGIMTNDVLVDRYEITLANVDPEAEGEYTTFDDAYVDIARDGGHVVRMKLDGMGFNNSFSVDQSEPRPIEYELNFSEFGTISEFTPPPGCGDGLALDLSGDQAVINWGATNPIFIPNAGSADDPFFHIHTSNDEDGFFLSFEMYTVYGQAWTGQTGTFPIDCSDPTSSTGICVHFDPDGPGPLGNVGADFGATGMVTVIQLDDGGYEVQVDDLAFTDGTTFAPFTMAG